MKSLVLESHQTDILPDCCILTFASESIHILKQYKTQLNQKMKTLSLVAVCMIIVVTSFAQPSFKISGHIEGLNSGIAKLSYITGQQTRQISTEINNGSFVFKGSLPEQELLQISFSSETGNIC